MTVLWKSILELRRVQYKRISGHDYTREYSKTVLYKWIPEDSTMQVRYKRTVMHNKIL